MEKLRKFDASLGTTRSADGEAAEGLPFNLAGTTLRYPAAYANRPIPATARIEFIINIEELNDITVRIRWWCARQPAR
jgi:hypothetical protein